MSDWRCSRMKRRRDEGEYILSDLWPDILKRLPAKKLLQVQCVCKSWKSLISSSSFVSCHNQNTIATSSVIRRSGGSRLQLTENFYVEGSKLILEKSCALQHEDTSKFTPLGFPNIPKYVTDRLWDPHDMLHGVIFLRYVQVDDRNKSLLCVWNPCIRKHVILPWPVGRFQRGPLGIRFRTFYRLEGMWFDAANNDFKVVRSELEGSYDLLSVRSGVWRMNLPFPPSCLIKDGMRLYKVKGSFFNGALHWIVGPDDEAKDPLDQHEFLQFDCAREEFNVVDLPSQLVKGSKNRALLFLLDLGGGPMLSLANFSSTGTEDCELWLMQPGSSSSWARLDRDHPQFADAATRDVISCSGLTFKPFLHHHQARFMLKDDCPPNSYHFKETMMLMDIGITSSSKLHHRIIFHRSNC